MTRQVMSCTGIRCVDRSVQRQVSPVKAPSGLKLTGSTQAVRALRPTSAAASGATLVGSMRQRRRGQPAGKHMAAAEGVAEATAAAAVE